jgi:hypothetical protein
MGGDRNDTPVRENEGKLTLGKGAPVVTGFMVPEIHCVVLGAQ